MANDERAVTATQNVSRNDTDGLRNILRLYGSPRYASQKRFDTKGTGEMVTLNTEQISSRLRERLSGGRTRGRAQTRTPLDLPPPDPGVKGRETRPPGRHGPILRPALLATGRIASRRRGRVRTPLQLLRPETGHGRAYSM